MAGGADLVLGGAGLVVMIVGLGLLVRSVGWRPVWSSPVVALTRPQNRQLSQEVRGRAPGRPRHLRVARDMAARMADQRGPVAMFTGMVILWLGPTIAAPSTLNVISTVALPVLLIPAGVSNTRNRRRARELLERNPAPHDATAG